MVESLAGVDSPSDVDGVNHELIWMQDVPKGDKHSSYGVAKDGSSIKSEVAGETHRHHQGAQEAACCDCQTGHGQTG